MFRGYRRFVSLALCVCFTLSMLFLNTLDVNAASPISYSLNCTGRVTADAYEDHVFGSVSGSSSGSVSSSASGSISGSSRGSVSGSVSTSSKGSGTAHVVIPITVQGSWNDLDIGEVNQDGYYLITGYLGGLSLSVTSNGVDTDYRIYNKCVRSADGTLLWSDTATDYYSREVKNGSDVYDGNFRYTFSYEFDIAFDALFQLNTGVHSVLLDYVLSGSYGVYCWGSTKPSMPVNDSQANQSLDNIQSSSETTANNSGGILSKITEFFGSFFSNLIGVFVPEDGYFSSWFTRLNTLLADKLGMLYAPFDLLIQVLTSILNADDSFAGIPFPGIEWDGQYLVEPFTFTFSSLGDVYTDLQGYVYFGTDVILLLAFFGLLQDKIKHILED